MVQDGLWFVRFGYSEHHLTNLQMAIPEKLWNCWHFWQLRISMHDSHSDLTKKSDTGQHLQFLRCFTCIFPKEHKWFAERWFCVINNIHPYLNQSHQQCCHHHHQYHQLPGLSERLWSSWWRAPWWSSCAPSTRLCPGSQSRAPIK